MRVEENKKNIADYVEKLEKRIEEDEKRVNNQTGPSVGTDLNSCGSPPLRGQPTKQSSYNIKPAIEEVGPKLATIQERQGSIRTSLQFHKHDEDSIDEDLDVEKIRKKLMRKYASVFKRDLGKEDRVRMDPVKVELIDENKDMGNVMVPSETPRHLQKAADIELQRLLNAGCLEPVNHPTRTCSRAFFIMKNKKDGTIEARLICDLKRCK